MAPVVWCDFSPWSQTECGNVSKFGLCGDPRARKKKLTLSPVFFQQQNFDKYLNHPEMRPLQVPVKLNGA